MLSMQTSSCVKPPSAAFGESGEKKSRPALEASSAPHQSPTTLSPFAGTTVMLKLYDVRVDYCCLLL